MRGTKRENFKNAVIAILFGALAATNITWRDTLCAVGGGYLVSNVMWYFLTAYDEILRKRRESTWNYKKQKESI